MASVNPVVESEVVDLLRLQPIKIDVVERQAGPCVFLDDGKGRTRHFIVDRAQAARESTDKRRLASPELPVEQHHRASRQRAGEPLSRGCGLLFCCSPDDV